MKNSIFIVILLILVIFIFTRENISTNNNPTNSTEVRAVFVSYIELSKYIKNKDVEEAKQNIKTIIENTKNFNFNTIILQVRSFSDAIYESKIFPWSSVVSSIEGTSPGFDVLDYFISICNKNNIKIYAWINPYRIRSSSKIEMSPKNPAYKYLDTDYLYEDNGLYYNPAKEEVTELIVSGVNELTTNYRLDAILFDDYFYPNPDLDYTDYLKYLESNDYISFDDFHFMNINNMIRKVHDICKKNNIPFGISPDGNIENNYSKIYADVKTWLSTDKYIDFIMPQIYYGFFNETKAFKKVIDEWNGLIKNEDIKLYIALAFYKVGLPDQYAKSGVNEWIDNDNIIMREIMLSRNLKYYQGFSLFRYDYLFNEELYTNTTMLEKENIKKILN